MGGDGVDGEWNLTARSPGGVKLADVEGQPLHRRESGQVMARNDVVIYDVGMPYTSSWDLLEAIRAAPALQSQPFVITTPNKRKLEQAVGPTSAIEIGLETDLGRVLTAVQAARTVRA